MSSSSFDAEFSSPSVLPPIRKSSSKAKNYNCPQEPSNEAFRLYVPFIESLSPKIVVRENSLGILGSVVVARAMICCCFFFSGGRLQDKAEHTKNTHCHIIIKVPLYFVPDLAKVSFTKPDHHLRNRPQCHCEVRRTQQ